MVPPVTGTFANFVVNCDYRGISQKAIGNAKLHILDTIGAALASIAYPVGQIALDYCKRSGGSAEAVVWGSNLKASLPAAAFTNGLLAHGIDFDDWEAVLTSGHPSCMIVASSLSAGESVGASGKDVLKAYTLGIEIYNRIAAGAPNIRRRGFHGTPIFGSMGSVAAAASLLGLNAEKTRMAFGIAASGASGIQRQHGTMTKPYHAGNAARNGVEAVLLAASGFTSDDAIFESHLGFCDTLFGEKNCDYQKMLQDLGDPYYLDSPGLSFKPYPFSTPQFLAAEAVLYLVQHDRLNYNDIAGVEIRVPPIRYQRHFVPEVKSELQTKFAINYVAAIGILEGKYEKQSFSDAKLNDPKIKEALNKVKIILDSSIPESSKEEFCPVTIELCGGAKVSYTTTVPKGHPNNPVKEDEVIDKFRSNVKNILSSDGSEKVIALTRELDQLPNIQQFTELLVP